MNVGQFYCWFFKEGCSYILFSFRKAKLQISHTEFPTNNIFFLKGKRMTHSQLFDSGPFYSEEGQKIVLDFFSLSFSNDFFQFLFPECLVQQIEIYSIE